MTLEEGGRRRVATLSLKLGLLLGLLLLPPLAGDASLAATRSRAGGTRGQIVFLSDRTPGLGSFGVAVMNGDGSGQHLLTRPEPRATDPVWLPGGRQIAFESVASPGDWEVCGGVWLMRAHGAAAMGRTRLFAMVDRPDLVARRQANGVRQEQQPLCRPPGRARTASRLSELPSARATDMGAQRAATRGHERELWPGDLPDAGACGRIGSREACVSNAADGLGSVMVAGRSQDRLHR
jgi:hypothetical protein